MPANVKINDPKGNAAEVTLTYSPYRWSPQGRFLLTQVQPQDSSIHWVGIVDTRTNRLGMIPGSYGASIDCIAWTWDGSLLVPRAPESNPPQPAQVDLWEVLPTREDLVLLDRSYPLPGEALSGTGAALDLVQDVLPCWFKQASDQVVRSAIIQQQTGKILAISGWHLRYGSLPGSQPLNLAAADPLWAPDGSSLLLAENPSQAGNNRILYISLDDHTLQDLRPALGEDACCFNWIPRPGNRW